MREKMEWSFLLLILTSQCPFLTCQLYEYHYIKNPQTWENAQKYCREKHTDLATVYDLKDMERLCDGKSRCEEGWIGLYNEVKTNRTWHWSLPGVEFDDNNTLWKDGEPNDYINDREDFVIMQENSHWVDVDAVRKAFFTCYNETDPSNFTLIETKKTWIQAQEYCRKNHTDLISGLDQIEQWKRRGNSGEIFIGLFRDTWRWSDENSYSFRNWQNLSNSENLTEKCAATGTDGRWKAECCKLKKHFFCYDDNVILIQQNKTWDEALNYCRENHYDLAHITNKDEQRWMGWIAQKADSPFVWLGLHYTCTLQFWFWVTDKAVRYKEWASDGSMNHCDMSGAMERGGKNKWYKKPDQHKYNFICYKNNSHK